MKRPALIALLASMLPFIAVHLAYLVNLAWGSELETRFICLPYTEGCVSISRAARSGPGLYLFRAIMLPSAVLLAMCWWQVRMAFKHVTSSASSWQKFLPYLGMTGALFLVLYVTALGNEGEWYSWQRRYGVTVYFGGTALAQLMLAAVLWPRRNQWAGGRLAAPTAALMVLVSLQWALGLLSVGKRLLISDPDLMDRIENLIEWWFALPMTLAFIVIAWMFLRIEDGDGAGRKRISSRD